MLVVRDVSRPSTDARSAKAALIPNRPASDSLTVIGVAKKPLAFLAFYNSTTFDFLVRGKMPGPHSARTWTLSQIACPHPEEQDLSELESMASDLSATSFAVAELLDREPHRWNAEERYHVDVELDARVAHLYGLTGGEYEVVLDSFDVLARKQIDEYGSYRFKHDCLTEYLRLG